MAPPPSANLPLAERLKALAQTLQYVSSASSAELRRASIEDATVTNSIAFRIDSLGSSGTCTCENPSFTAEVKLHKVETGITNLLQPCDASLLRLPLLHLIRPLQLLLELGPVLLPPCLRVCRCDLWNRRV